MSSFERKISRDRYQLLLSDLSKKKLEALQAKFEMRNSCSSFPPRLDSPSAIASCYVINYGSLRNRLKEHNSWRKKTVFSGWPGLGLYT